MEQEILASMPQAVSLSRQINSRGGFDVVPLLHKENKFMLNDRHSLYYASQMPNCTKKSFSFSAVDVCVKVLSVLRYCTLLHF